jgi:hypothetical protein
MSGETTLRRPRTMEWQNTHYQANLKLLELENATLETRKHAFYNTNAEELAQKLPAFQHWSPTVDGSFIPAEVNLGMLSNVSSPVGKPEWCEAIMIGDVEHDVSIMIQHLNEKMANFSRAHVSKVASWMIRM